MGEKRRAAVNLIQLLPFTKGEHEKAETLEETSAADKEVAGRGFSMHRS
jgi:hypothetical protein